MKKFSAAILAFSAIALLYCNTAQAQIGGGEYRMVPPPDMPAGATFRADCAVMEFDGGVDAVSGASIIYNCRKYNSIAKKDLYHGWQKISDSFQITNYGSLGSVHPLVPIAPEPATGIFTEYVVGAPANTTPVVTSPGTGVVIVSKRRYACATPPGGFIGHGEIEYANVWPFGNIALPPAVPPTALVPSYEAKGPALTLSGVNHAAGSFGGIKLRGTNNVDISAPPNPVNGFLTCVPLPN